MATVLQKLKDDGWYISEEGLKKLNENGAITDAQELIRRALDMDLREIISNGGYPSDGSSKLNFGRGLVLQVTNIRNMSAPKANQESKTSPRLLQIDMTDGQTYCSGLEMEHLPMFNMNIAPGTKILIRNIVKTIQGIMSLSPLNITILGGKVAAIYEKWESNRTLAKLGAFCTRQSATGSNCSGPPPWIPFGQKALQRSVDADHRSFRSFGLGIGEKTKQSSNENIEFLTIRNQAIAESIKIGTRKVFGGGNRQLMDHNVKKILDKGFTEEQAKYALKIARNNLERAMSSLKRNTVEAEQKPNELNGRSNPLGRDRGVAYQERSGATGRCSRSTKNEEGLAAKPSGKVSLFDYLENKIKIPESTVLSTMPTATTSFTNTPQNKSFNSIPNYSCNRPLLSSSGISNTRYRSNNSTETNNNNKSKFENNISSSFASRQKKDEDFSHSIQPSNQNSTSIISNHRPAKKNEDVACNIAGKGTKVSFPPYPATQQQSQLYCRQKSSGSDRSHQFESGSQYQSQSNQINYLQKSAKANTVRRYPPGKTNVSVQSNHHQYNEIGNNKHMLHERKTFYPNANSSSKLSNISDFIDCTSNLKISSDVEQASTQRLPHNKFEEIFPQLPKANAYNPYKIMGFQNKESNEFAMNVLKTQAMDLDTGAMQSPQIVQQSQPNISFYPPHQDKYETTPQPPNQQIFGKIPPPNIAAPIPNFIVADTNATYAWNFKKGDRCLAKYWEDENYYNAEIQAVTDKTCVVHFLDYGNAEEVLLADCLPITDTNHQPINHYNGKLGTLPYHHTQIKMMTIPHQPPQPQYQTNHGQNYQHQMQQHRFRNDRQVYVPPAQRK